MQMQRILHSLYENEIEMKMQMQRILHSLRIIFHENAKNQVRVIRGEGGVESELTFGSVFPAVMN
jgi:hypothetical protein